MTAKKIAIVYDWIDKWGGVERVLLTLHEMFPKAEFFTSYYDEKTAPWANDLKIQTSFIQKFPNFIKKSRILSFPFYPYAFESFDFAGYDLVVSVSSSFAKSVITRPGTLHICYLLTPTRYFWVEPETYLQGIKKIGKLFLPYLRKWDYVAAQRPDKIISISQEVADRCKKFYRRESEVLYPPFDEEYWKKISSSLRSRPNVGRSNLGKYFLVVSRLEPYKRVDLALRLFKRSKSHLVVVGKGSQERLLKAEAGENVTFLQDVSDEELAILYKYAEALIMPQLEDFGYTALEAQYFGCPVVSYKSGGAMETVIDGKTGIFFEKQTVKSLQDAIKRYEKISKSLKQSTTKNGPINVMAYSKSAFVDKFKII